MTSRILFCGIRASKKFFHAAIITVIASLIFMFSEIAYGQVPSYAAKEVFNTNIPYTPALTVNRKVTTTDWSQAKISGNGSAPNDFQWVSTGANPVAGNQNIVGFPAGAGFVRYINRANLSPFPAISGAVNGDAAFLASRSFDYSGHNSYNQGGAVPDTIGLSIFRDGTAGAVASVPDSITVWLNTQPSLSGAVKLNYTYINGVLAGPGSIINRSSTLAPVATAGWNRYAYQIPNLPQFLGVNASSSVYIIVACYSVGGNNIFLDNFNFPQWPTTMTIADVKLTYQENADVGKGSTNNILLGVTVTTKGSLTPLKADALSFATNGSNAWASDTQNPFAYYTGGTNIFSNTSGAVQMPSTTSVVNSGGLNFGWTVGTPAIMTLNPGAENYFWFAVDVKATATTLNYVGAELQFLTASIPGSTYFGNNGTNLVSSVDVLVNPIPAQTFNLARQIEQAYIIPTYSAGTSWPGGGYYNNDYISAVNLVGDNLTKIDNYVHDASCGSCIAVGGQFCDRFSCHPPDYTQFKPVNNGLYKERFVQVTVGRGIRTTTASYTIKAECGQWFSSNTVGIGIDWNKDGDFNDSYNGTGGIITENMGAKSQLQSNMSLPKTIWGANTSWVLNVPASTDIVTNVGGAGGPVFIGNVRMRVREIFAYPAGPTMDLTNSGYTWGEVEDYTIQVLPDCPTSTSNVCKWLGNTSDWSNPNNWCPKVPDRDDIAFISPSTAPLVGPTILENTNAECRTLSLQNGATLTIDAYKNSSLDVYDDVVIGSNLAGSNSSIVVNSAFIKTQTIPGASNTPPAGLGFPSQSPLKNIYHSKTQIAYTATELSTTYGWKPGDVIDQIGFLVATIIGGAAPSAWPNFQIVVHLKASAFATVNPFPFPVLPTYANTKIAYSIGDLGLVSTVVYTTPSLALNMPGGGTAPLNFQNLVLTTPFTWNGENMIISIEFKQPAGALPGRAYNLYTEADSKFSTLNLQWNTAGATITGWNIDGDHHYNNIVTGSAVTATVSNQRPRLDFHRTRPYDVFPFTVKGDWINNNKIQRLAPNGIVPGDSGFIAGKSRVIFDPTNRNLVNSPGLAATNIIYYAGIPGAILPANADQEITSKINVGGVTAQTVFNGLEINKNFATGVVKQNSVLPNITLGMYTDTLWITQGEFSLNLKTFTLRKPTANALVRTAGWIRSEDPQNRSRFSWVMGTNTGPHVIPFGVSATGYAPFTYNGVTGDIGTLTVSTYHTALSDNLPYSLDAVDTVKALNDTLGVNAGLRTIDRFWDIRKSGGIVTNIVTFGYQDALEGTTIQSQYTGALRAQSWGTTGWHWPQGCTYPSVIAPINCQQVVGSTGLSVSVTVNDIRFGHWTIMNPVGGIPLPISLIDFTAKVIDKKVWLGWTVQSERDVTKYDIERTIDNNNFEFITAKEPIGPSTGLLSYDAWDNHPLNGLQYYRLATSFTDGSTDYSKLVPIRFGTDGTFAINNVILNTNGDLTVNFVYDSKLPCSYLVIDVLGKVIASGKVSDVQIGNNIVEIPAYLSQGVYTITLANDEKRVSQKLVN